MSDDRQTLTTRGFVLVARRPALDLCNTHLGATDLLGVPADLGRWLEEAGLTDRAPAISDDELRAARRLRDALRPALLASDGPAVAALADAWLEEAPVRLCVERETLRPHVTGRGRSSACLLVDAVMDAVDTVREHPGRVRECAGERCPVVFLDESRNGSRRWCSMGVCGARAKASAYYRRRHS
jgi:predicted RNA-binding Zn ribbon-like protein